MDLFQKIKEPQMKRRNEMRHVVVLLSLLCASAAFSGETDRVGGTGGERTVTADCGSTGFIVGLEATGGKNASLIGMNLVRTLRFTCRQFSGATGAATTTTTPEMRAGDSASELVSRSTVLCPTSMVISTIEARSAMFVDRLVNTNCRDNGTGLQVMPMNVGGDGGSRTFLSCPQGEGLYKVVARLSGAVDSLKGSCRSITGLASQPVSTQIQNTASPNPSPSTPMRIAAKSSASIRFTILETGVGQSINLGIFGETDLLGGGQLSPAEYKLEVLNPAGTVIASKIVKNPPLGIVQKVAVTFTSASTNWKFRITNLRDFGTLEVKVFESRTN
jgi:hypothetical protein